MHTKTTMNTRAFNTHDNTNIYACPVWSYTVNNHDLKWLNMPKGSPLIGQGKVRGVGMRDVAKRWGNKGTEQIWTIVQFIKDFVKTHALTWMIAVHASSVSFNFSNPFRCICYIFFRFFWFNISIRIGWL